ncbi:MAG: beta-galactosidase, partial [Phycisphaerae bacterium]|nr:beta-galactosidase [Phycisphaerae bacterium]
MHLTKASLASTLANLAFAACITLAARAGAASGAAEAPPVKEPVPAGPVALGGVVFSLAGPWRFALDREGKGEGEKWFSRRLDDTVKLPGTTDENHKGVLKDEQCIDRLSRVWYWKGKAWYQRDVTVPESWKGKHVTLLLERTKHTTVWVDDISCGTQDSLSAPLIFDLTNAMTPGEHTLTLLVDNSILPPVGQSHAFDERTQTNWNGIVGRIEIRVTDPAWLDDVQVYPDVQKRTAVIRAVIGNITGGPVEGELEVSGKTRNTDNAVDFRVQSFPVRVADASGTVEVTYKLGEDAPLWDEFSPAMIRLKLDMIVRSAKDAAQRDCRTVDFGLRQFAAKRGQFTINGRVTFLRGKNDACIFPLTGYPPMDKAGWLRVLGISKSYGINHYRFHSWCPPEAAFAAADELGIYLQPELPNKATGFHKPEHGGYLKSEGERIFLAYCNHPSFVMFALGNELGRQEAMFEMVRHFRRIDGRHLYAQGSNNMHWMPSLAAGDDFWVTGKTSSQLPVRGSFFQGDYATSHIEHRPPSTMVDFSESIAGVSVPVIGHETGQFQVSPDFREIPKYTGVLKARNLEIYRQRLTDANMLDQADDFVRASGALSVICYREDIEAALRTPGFGGIQLLDIQDFPGQGTALVGILNAFMESKGLVAPQAWRQFCCETVGLLRMTKHTWTTDETFIGRVQVAHYG